MTNEQAQAYAIIAIKNLIKAGKIKADGFVYNDIRWELFRLFDEIDEDEAEERAARILTGA